jgi:tight adherence protein B
MMEFLPPLGLVVLVAGTVMVVFLLVRAIVDRGRAAWRRRFDSDDDAGLLTLPAEPVPVSWQDHLDQRFKHLMQETGLGWTTRQALGVMMVTAVTLAGLALLGLGEPVVISLALVLGIGVPLGGFLILRVRWRRKIQNQLPDAFYLLARSLRAGLNLEQALAMAAQHGSQPLASEFHRASEQIEMGLAVPAALQGMAHRLRLPDFNVLVTAVTLHRTLGGNLTLLMDRVAASTRDRNLFRGYFLAATALGRITATFLVAAAPLLFLGYAIWQPEFVTRFTESAGGLRALAIAATLEIVGIIWIYSLLRTDY